MSIECKQKKANTLFEVFAFQLYIAYGDYSK